ncbi:uncharacterized protein TNCV_3228931 [Trichonephila clavipes]|nr:uncharacterized protein TNCV_3228931 [Trichonephila clavipes]
MSRKKQRSAFDQVFEFDRGRIVAYRDWGSSFREIGSRVGRNQTAVMRICDRWMQKGTTEVDRIHLSAPLHEEQALANEQTKQRMAQILAEEAAEQRAARLDDARF